MEKVIYAFGIIVAAKLLRDNKEKNGLRAMLVYIISLYYYIVNSVTEVELGSILLIILVLPIIITLLEYLRIDREQV